jgi:hypothetical protein
MVKAAVRVQADTLPSAFSRKTGNTSLQATSTAQMKHMGVKIGAGHSWKGLLNYCSFYFSSHQFTVYDLLLRYFRLGNLDTLSSNTPLPTLIVTLRLPLVPSLTLNALPCPTGHRQDGCRIRDSMTQRTSVGGEPSSGILGATVGIPCGVTSEHAFYRRY